MSASPDSLLASMKDEGFAVIPGVFVSERIDSMIAGLDRAFKNHVQATPIRSDAGSVYAARNLLDLWPAASTLWRQPPLPAALAAILGPEFGLVRVLYFDKPPERTWTLPWHKDLTIAVREHLPGSALFSKPTVKAGVPHVEAPAAVLATMVTLRIHLDDVTEENGPLEVVAGSHRTGKELKLGHVPPQKILVRRGDALLMRPLLAHASGRSRADTRLHRRILHFEFADSVKLPDGYAWHQFVPA